MIWLIVLVFTSITLSVAAFLALQAERILRRERIQQFAVGYGQPAEPEEERSFYDRLIAPLWRRTKKKQQRRLKRASVQKLETQLLQAGSPYGMGPVEFRLLQNILMMALPLFMAGFSLLLGAAVPIVMLLSLLGLLAAAIYPKLMLRSRTRARGKQALKELPDTMDLFTISLEAGLGFDAAVSKVVEKKDGILSGEFKTYLEEVRLGQTRRAALSAINDRLALEELRALIYNVIQAEKLGIGMVSVLRVQTEDIREKRKQHAEEAAMKAPIKMLFPLVIFIFPTLFIILLGPAVLQLVEAFSN
ncbi:type II secretion system F family protein [Bacillus daqingensis]|uniref:Type II secretion system F family protein n=1 Tax=Bacillus daqingensis TaxID=872396 RepID=A0ABV9NV48_9BACI